MPFEDLRGPIVKFVYMRWPTALHETTAHLAPIDAIISSQQQSSPEEQTHQLHDSRIIHVYQPRPTATNTHASPSAEYHHVTSHNNTPPPSITITTTSALILPPTLALPAPPNGALVLALGAPPVPVPFVLLVAAGTYGPLLPPLDPASGVAALGVGVPALLPAPTGERGV